MSIKYLNIVWTLRLSLMFYRFSCNPKYKEMNKNVKDVWFNSTDLFSSDMHDDNTTSWLTDFKFSKHHGQSVLQSKFHCEEIIRTKKSKKIERNKIMQCNMSIPSESNAVKKKAQLTQCLRRVEYIKMVKSHKNTNHLHHIDQQDVMIKSSAGCLKNRSIEIHRKTNLRVTVDNCCVTNCSHEIIIRTAKSVYSFLMFTNFNIPGNIRISNKSDERLCQESLSISAISRSGQEQNFGTFCGERKPSVFYVDQNKVKLTLSLHENRECINGFNYEVLIDPCISFPYRSCTSSYMTGHFEGIISTPGLIQSRNYPNNMRCQWNITAPQNKLIKIDQKKFDIAEGDILTITRIRNSFIDSDVQFPHVIIFTKNNPMRTPIVLPSYQCIIDFTSDEILTDAGLKLSYSAVNKNKFIPMTNKQHLNCSVKNKLPRSIVCDYISDCHGKQDEHGCSYESETLCKSGVVFKNSCYHFKGEWENGISWIQAEVYCTSMFNGHLISLNTKAEKDFFENNLRKKYKIKKMFLGLKRMNQKQVPQMYRRLWRWTDGTTALYLPREFRFESWQYCSLMTESNVFHATECYALKISVSVVCETKIGRDPFIPINNRVYSNISSQKEISSVISTFKCESGELISSDQRCDMIFGCFDRSDETDCTNRTLTTFNYPFSLNFDRYSCTGQYVPYGFVCNGIKECINGMDESICEQSYHSIYDKNIWLCKSGMKISGTLFCNGKEDCFDSSDEEECEHCQGNSSLCPGFYCMPNHWIDDGEIDCPIRDSMGQRVLEKHFEENVHDTPPPPGVVKPDTFGKMFIRALEPGEVCNSTHFQCKEGYCIPVYMLCNGIMDCPYGEDEISEQCVAACQGLYKCRLSRNCISFEQVCDGRYNCPLKDDEHLCTLTNGRCPSGCICTPNEYKCNQTGIIYLDKVEVHKLDISFNELESLQSLSPEKFGLRFLNASCNRITHVNNTELQYPNLLILELEKNLINSWSESSFKNCPNIISLNLAHNNLQFNSRLSFLQPLKRLAYLYLNGNKMSSIKDRMFDTSSSINSLFLRDMNIYHISNKAFINQQFLVVLDLRGNDIKYYPSRFLDIFSKLHHLKADIYQLCCQHMIPKMYHIPDCDAPFDEISSCSDMLGSTFLRMSLWLMAVLTISGNIGVIVQRIFRDESRRITFRIIIVCLAISDLLMGIFLVIIGVADFIYKDEFLLSQRKWKDSIACQTAGFLCMLSSESSALFILLATIDRVLAICLPLNQNIQLTHRSASIASIFIWIIAMVIASIPLVPPFDEWRLYSQLAVGVPLPIMKKELSGFDFAFSIFIIFNMVIFIIVIVGQVAIWVSIKKASSVMNVEARAKKDMVVAQRLFLVVLTDCFCWFPISLMGILSRFGVAIPGTMCVVASVYLLPANSALNPYIYTLNSLLVKRRERKYLVSHHGQSIEIK